MLKLVSMRVGWAFSLLVWLSACDPLISAYTEQAYENATRLKAESLALIAKSGQPFSSRRTEVEELLVDVDAAYEYARGLPKNEVVTQQWDTLRDPEGNLLGGWARRWQAQGTLSEVFRGEIAVLIGQAFDQIICVEINKREPSAC